MLGFTRCASTACFTAAAEYIAGIPVCPAHKDELQAAFTLARPDADRHGPYVPKSPKPKKLRKGDIPPAIPTPPPAPTRRAPGEVRITSRTRLTPQQQATDPATATGLGCVYYITWRRDTEFVKIGTTRKASARFKQLTSPTGDRPRLLVAEPGGLEHESFRHSQFASIRKPGTELFLYTDEIVDHIAFLRQQYPDYRGLTDVGRSFD